MSDAQTPELWTNKQLLLEAEVIVAGQFGISAVYDVLKRIRDGAAEEQRQRDKARIDQLCEMVGGYAISATSDGWCIALLEGELERIREKLKDVPPVYDELDRWLYGNQEDDDGRTATVG